MNSSYNTAPLLLSLGLCLIASTTVPLIHIPLMRLRRKPQEVLIWMFVSFVCSFVVWLFLFSIFKPTEVFLPSEFLFGLFLLGFLYLGYMEMMFKLYRGFSHTILTDVWRLEPVSPKHLADDFAEGTGLEEMLNRRIKGLITAGFITIRDNSIELTRKGRTFAVITSAFKSFLGLGPGG